MEDDAALSLSWECKLWTVSFDQNKIREFVFSPPLQRWRVQCPSGDQSQLRHEHVPASWIFKQHLLSSMLCWLIELVSRWGGVGQWEDLSGWKGQNPLRNPSWGKGSFSFHPFSELFSLLHWTSLEDLLQASRRWIQQGSCKRPPSSLRLSPSWHCLHIAAGDHVEPLNQHREGEGFTWQIPQQTPGVEQGSLQRWKKRQTLQTRLCYFSQLVLIFRPRARKTMREAVFSRIFWC